MIAAVVAEEAMTQIKSTKENGRVCCLHTKESCSAENEEEICKSVCGVLGEPGYGYLCHIGEKSAPTYNGTCLCKNPCPAGGIGGHITCCPATKAGPVPSKC